MKRLLILLLCVGLLQLPVQAAPQEKLVALTFDDGPSGRFTRQLLEGLEARNAKATFFLCGYRMEQYPQLTEQIHSQGHEIGLHGYSHKAMDNMCTGDISQEFEAAKALLPEGCQVTFLRSPGGSCGQCVRTAANRLGLAVLSWSVDPRDWATHDAAAVQHRVVSQIRDGDVILLHDMSDSSVAAALGIIDRLQAQGFRFVTAAELARARGIDPAPGVQYARFLP